MQALTKVNAAPRRPAAAPAAVRKPNVGVGPVRRLFRGHAAGSTLRAGDLLQIEDGTLLEVTAAGEDDSVTVQLRGQLMRLAAAAGEASGARALSALGEHTLLFLDAAPPLALDSRPRRPPAGERRPPPPTGHLRP